MSRDAPGRSGRGVFDRRPRYVNLLPLWLTSDTVPLWFRLADLLRDTHDLQRFVP